LNNADAKVYLGFKLSCAIDIRTVPLSQFNKDLILPENYGKGMPVDIKGKYHSISTNFNTEFDEELCPPSIRKLDPLTFKDLFVGYEWARYNAYGDGGILMKFVVDGYDVFYYTNTDNYGNTYCYRYDGIASWQVASIPTPKPGDYTAALFSSQFALKFSKEIAPTVFDVAGSIPVIGIPFNVVNGVWYIYKDEKANAYISFASCIPIEGVALLGIKYASVVIQTGEKSYKLLKVSEETNGVIKTVLSNAEGISKSSLDDGIKNIITITDKYPEYSSVFKSLAEQVKDYEKLKTIINKIGSLDDASLFLKDISIVSGDANHIANNLNKIDDGIIDAWLLLDGSSVIRKGFDNLENLSKVLKSEIYKNWGTIEELKAAINKSTSKAKLIENLSKANPASKYPMEGLRDLAAYWKDPIKVKRFKEADEFYSNMGLSNYDNHLRGIDFDKPVIQITKGKEMYQLATKNNDGTIRFGNYYFENVAEDVSKLGIGDLERIKADKRIMVKVKFKEDVVFLQSKTANIEDFRPPYTEIFEGNGNQFFNPNAKDLIDLNDYEIVKTYE
jgi:hypothetical protein